jgi:hypothetical protein
MGNFASGAKKEAEVTWKVDNSLDGFCILPHRIAVYFLRYVRLEFWTILLDGEEKTRLSQMRTVIQKEGRGDVSWLTGGISALSGP